MDKKQLVGVITASDIVSGFIEVMGLLQNSTRLDVIINKEGGVEEVTRIIKDAFSNNLSDGFARIQVGLLSQVTDADIRLRPCFAFEVGIDARHDAEQG